MKAWLQENRDALIHVWVAVPFVLGAIFWGPLGVATLNTLLWIAREQSSIGVTYRRNFNNPHPWKPWQWGQHKHIEWSLPALAGFGVALGWMAATT